MDTNEYDNPLDHHSMDSIETDSGLYADQESVRLELAGIFSNRFSNINLLHRQEYGVSEIHTATRYGKRFVLKGLRPEHRDDPLYNMCMAKEFEIGITLDHPNIRRTIGFENVENLGKRIVLEFIDGITLAEMFASGNTTSEKAASIAIQVADALKYLHSKQICHRDLKPENILIPHQGDTVKIIDFNLSDSDDYIVLKNPAGSKRYMAPELSEPNSRPTPETDYYSLGVIMHELSKASGNQLLELVAERCMDHDPCKRTEGFEMLIKGIDLTDNSSVGNSILSSKTLTYFLAAICIILSVFITIHYIS